MWFPVATASPCKNSYDLSKPFQLIITLHSFVKFLRTAKPIPSFFDSNHRSPQHGYFGPENISWLSLSSHRRNCAQFLLLSRLDRLCLTTVLYQVPLQVSIQEKCRRSSNEKVNYRSCQIRARILILHRIYSNNHLHLLHFQKALRNVILFSTNPFSQKAGASVNNASFSIFIKKPSIVYQITVGSQ